MKFNIQLFAWTDELINDYKNDINNTKKEMTNLDNEKNTLLNDYNKNYNDQLNQYDDLMKQQQNNIDTWANTEKENQQKQTDFETNLINQNKEEAQKQTDTELGNAYIDYQKGLNQFSGNAEKMASNGLTGTGFSKNEEIAMNVTYQNRVSTAKSALLKANTEYDNQIQQALLNNDSKLAEIALQQMQQSYQLALQGFEYKTNLYNNKIAYEKDVNDTYFNQKQTLQSRIDSYNSEISTLNKIQQEYEMEKAQRDRAYQQWLAEFNENQRQFNAQMAEQQRQYNSSFDYGYSDTSNYTSSGNDNAFGNSSSTTSKSDYYFSNGYQPQYIENTKLSSSEKWVVSNILTTSECNQLGIKQTQKVWQANGKYYIWIGSARQYQDVTDIIKKAKKQGLSGGKYCINKSML